MRRIYRVHIILLSKPKFNTSSRETPDKEHGNFQVNNFPLIEEYNVINSEIQVDKNNQYGQELDDDDVTSDSLIGAFIFFKIISTWKRKFKR